MAQQLPSKLPSSYSEETAKEILKRAIDLQGDHDAFTRDQLAEMASDLGISPDALARAEQSWLADQEGAAERQNELAERAAFERERRQGYRMHLATFIIINTFLFLLNVVTSFGDWWFIYPMLGWGIGMAIHTVTMLQRDGDSFDREYQQWRVQRQLKRRIEQKVYGKLSE